MNIAVITVLLFGVCQTSSHRLPGFVPTLLGSAEIDDRRQKTAATISNKNGNAVLAVDPKTVASELMRLIDERKGKPQGRRTIEEYHTMEDIEKVITPVMAPARRGPSPSAFETAYALDHITRRAITKDGAKPPTMDEEIATRDVVAEMMKTLQSLTEGEPKEDEPEESDDGAPVARRTLNDTQDADPSSRAGTKLNDDDLVTIELEVSKMALRRALT